MAGLRPSVAHCATLDSGVGSPTRMTCEKSDEVSAAFARALIRLCALSSANDMPPVTKASCAYNISSALPLSRIRQSHDTRSLLGCWVRMVVVQFAVTALYQRG